MTPVEEALAELHTALREFVGLLEREAACLVDIDAEALAIVVAAKTRAANVVNTAWNRLVVTCGAVAGTEGLEAALAGLPNLQETWSEAKRLVNEAGRLNQSNSILVEAQMRRTRQALDVLQSAANRGTIYGANGLMVDNLQQRHTLDKA